MSLGHGEIAVELGDEVYELRPTLKAMKKIQQRFGGIRGAMEAVSQLNIEHIGAIIVAGANLGSRDIPDVEEAIFQCGIAQATEQIVPFITALMNPNGDTDKPETPSKKK